MPSANYEDLYDIESGIEQGCRTVLWGLYDVPAYTAEEAAVLEKEVVRVEIRFRLGEATGHLRVLRDGSRRPDHWRGQLALQLVTQPNPGAETHRQKRAQLRNLAAQLQQYLHRDEMLPYHQIFELPMDAGTTPVMKAENGFEYSTLLYGLLVAIRGDAWPLTD